MQNLQELKKKYEELGKEIEKLEKQKKNIRRRADFGEKYYTISTSGTVITSREENDEIDSFRYKIRNYFKTEEEAQRYLDNINTYYELMDLANELNNGEEIDWNNEKQIKYYIYFHKKEDILYRARAACAMDLGQIYCLNAEFLAEALKRIGKERLKKLSEENN